jgi:hypothetical protein
MIVSELIEHLQRLSQDKLILAVSLPTQANNIGSIVETPDSINMYIVRTDE